MKHFSVNFRKKGAKGTFVYTVVDMPKFATLLQSILHIVVSVAAHIPQFHEFGSAKAQYILGDSKEYGLMKVLFFGFFCTSLKNVEILNKSDLQTSNDIKQTEKLHKTNQDQHLKHPKSSMHIFF